MQDLPKNFQVIIQFRFTELELNFAIRPPDSVSLARTTNDLNEKIYK